MIIFILFIISWFAVGIWATYRLLIEDIKDRRYDEDYFDDDMIPLCLLSIGFGYITVCVFLYQKFKEKSHFVSLYKKLYSIANPDKKETDKKEK